MVLLMNQTGVLDRIHGDLSCIPPFVCTALVHMLREDIAGEVKKVQLRRRSFEFTPHAAQNVVTIIVVQHNSHVSIFPAAKLVWMC